MVPKVIFNQSRALIDRCEWANGQLDLGGKIQKVPPLWQFTHSWAPSPITRLILAFSQFLNLKLGEWKSMGLGAGECGIVPRNLRTN